MPPKHNTNAMEPPTHAETQAVRARLHGLMVEAQLLIDALEVDGQFLQARRVYDNAIRNLQDTAQRAIAALHSQPRED